MDQVDHRLGVRYPAGLLNKKLLNINLLNTKPPGTTGGSFCRDAPTIRIPYALASLCKEGKVSSANSQVITSLRGAKRRGNLNQISYKLVGEGQDPPLLI